jgi:prevent-host-death family protein
MPKVAASEFKARCLELMDRVAERREIYVITKRGKPVARLMPLERRPEEPLFGRLRGLGEEVGDITAPVVPAEEWEVVRLTQAGRTRRKRR